METKVCAWCEQPPTQYPCKTARKMNGNIPTEDKDEKGRYLQHLAECNMIVMENCSKETKDKWSKLKIKEANK